MEVRLSEEVGRCPKCHALTRAKGNCVECELMAKHAPEPPAEDDRLTLVERLVGLGIPGDMWALIAVCLMWLSVRLAVLGVVDGLALGLVELIFPVAVIIFHEQIGGFTGFVGSIPVTQECEPGFVKILGWAGLLALIGASCYSMFSA